LNTHPNKIFNGTGSVLIGEERGKLMTCVMSAYVYMNFGRCIRLA
jgi:hypothetical protein